MKLNRLATLTVFAAALAACSSVPLQNAQLDQARTAYRDAQTDGMTPALAPAELKLAGESLARAELSFANREDSAQVNQFAYLARQRSMLAREVASRKGAEAAVAAAGADTDKMRLAARTREADAASRDAASSQRLAADAQRQAAQSQQRAEMSQQQASQSQQQAGDAEARNRALQAQLQDLNAKKTDRGLVVTVGDVLFDTGRSELKSGSEPNIERIGNFLKAYPQRKALIEGYTDSTGGEQYNQALSGRRAAAVMAALVVMGVGRAQLTSEGYGETHPVAGNDNAAGRQMNRRVEIVLSDENGVLIPR